MTIEDDVKEFHRVQMVEEDILFNHLYEVNEYPWPIPSSDDLWFAGLKKYGKEFSNMECDIREPVVDIPIVGKIEVRYNEPKPLELIGDDNGYR